jgi:hypothetical protein
MDGRRYPTGKRALSLMDIEPAALGAPIVSSLAVTALVFLGSLIAVLGLFAAGDIVVSAVGLVAVAFGGVLEVLGRRTA